jgi:MFS family permease
MTENTSPKSQPVVLPYAWVILVVVFLASVAAPLNQAKIPPLMSVIMDAFQLTLGQAGWLMSVFALTGLLLSLPAGIFLQKFGPKILGLVALGCLVLGSAMGALSHNPGLLLFSRVIEGSGMGLIAVIAPAVIAMWFPPEKQGIPMGIWATWVPVGTVMVYVLAPVMTATFGWQSVWWFGAIFTLVVLLIYALLMRLPPWMATSSHKDIETTIVAEFKASLRVLKNRSIWLLGLVFSCFTLVFMGLVTISYLSCRSARILAFPGCIYLKHRNDHDTVFSAAGRVVIGSHRLAPFDVFNPISDPLCDVILSFQNLGLANICLYDSTRHLRRSRTNSNFRSCARGDEKTRVGWSGDGCGYVWTTPGFFRGSYPIWETGGESGLGVCG